MLDSPGQKDRGHCAGVVTIETEAEVRDLASGLICILTNDESG